MNTVRQEYTFWLMEHKHVYVIVLFTSINIAKPFNKVRGRGVVFGTVIRNERSITNYHDLFLLQFQQR